MDLRYLKAFIATIKTGSFSGAAQELNIAQSAISRQIKLLEESTQCDLIIRSSKRIILTEKGQALYELARNFLENVDHTLASHYKRPIRIGIVEGLLGSWFHQIVVTFYEKHTDNLKIMVASFGKLQRSLKEDKLDLIFTTENIQTELITSLKIFEEKPVIICNKPFSLEKLHQHRWIIYGNEDLLLRIHKPPAKQTLEVNSMPTILQFVRAGLGVAAVPEHILSDNDKFHVKAIPGHPEQSIYLACLNYLQLPDHIETLIRLVKKSRGPG